MYSQVLNKKETKKESEFEIDVAYTGAKNTMNDMMLPTKMHIALIT